MAWRAVVLAAAAVLLSCGDRSAEPQGAARAAAATPEVSRASERAPSLQRGDRHARAAARRSLPVKKVEGTVARVGERQVIIRRRGAPELALRVSTRTRVTVNGRPADVDGLREGAEVRAAYRSGDGGRATALSIDARSGGAPENGGRKVAPPGRAPDRG